MNRQASRGLRKDGARTSRGRREDAVDDRIIIDTDRTYRGVGVVPTHHDNIGIFPTFLCVPMRTRVLILLDKIKITISFFTSSIHLLCIDTVGPRRSPA
jgi:hypothetical protein